MRKILIGILIVLLIIMAYFAIFRGISIGDFKILSVRQISNENEKLTGSIDETKLLIDSSYPAKTVELDRSVSELLTAREEYLDLANVSTDAELKKASQQEEYTIEFLITRLGRHATSKGVNPKLEISAGTTGEDDVKNITFTVSGNYPNIIKFVEAIEDDSDLAFRIQNFKMYPGGENLTATFLVANVKIKQEQVSGSLPQTSESEQAPQENAEAEQNQETQDVEQNPDTQEANQTEDNNRANETTEGTTQNVQETR